MEMKRENDCRDVKIVDGLNIKYWYRGVRDDKEIKVPGICESSMKLSFTAKGNTGKWAC